MTNNFYYKVFTSQMSCVLYWPFGLQSPTCTRMPRCSVVVLWHHPNICTVFSIRDFVNVVLAPSRVTVLYTRVLASNYNHLPSQWVTGFLKSRRQVFYGGGWRESNPWSLLLQAKVLTARPALHPQSKNSILVKIDLQPFEPVLKLNRWLNWENSLI